MKIPAKVRIKARVSYEVLFSDLIQDDYECMGMTDFEKKQIILLNGQNETNLQKTWIHELCHAIAHEYGIEITHKAIYELEDAVLKLLKLNRWI